MPEGHGEAFWGLRRKAQSGKQKKAKLQQQRRENREAASHVADDAPHDEEAELLWWQRGILADDWEILAKALAESQAKKRRHASKSKPAVKVFKPPATAEEIRAQKSSVERLSTPKTSPDSTPTNLSPASFSRSRDFFDGDPPHYRWKHVEGARYCIGLFDEGPADEPGLWKTTPSASHGTHHSFCPKNSAKDNRQDLFEQPKPRATPEQVRRQRRSVARLSGTADPTVKRLARSEFSAKELSGLMGFPVEMPRPLAAVEAM